MKSLRTYPRCATSHRADPQAGTAPPVQCGLQRRSDSDGYRSVRLSGLLRYVDGLAGKHVELARELIPGVTRIAVLINARSSDLAGRRDVEAAASALAQATDAGREIARRLLAGIEVLGIRC